MMENTIKTEFGIYLKQGVHPKRAALLIKKKLELTFNLDEILHIVQYREINHLGELYCEHTRDA